MTPTERVLAALEARECHPRPSGNGWSARCPAHEDRQPSLSIAEGDDGRALIDCKAGCSPDAVCAALGMTMVNLFAPSTSTVFRPARGKREYRRPANGKPTDKPFTTACDALAELERRHGPRSGLWTYHNASGEPVGAVGRWNLPDGKKRIRPVSRHGDEWRIEAMPEPRPLYRLQDLPAAQRVYVCEGEKAADAARSIGLTATTSAHGCKSPHKADWRPLAGKEVVILPDNDPPGREYAEAVASILANLSPAPVVKLVELPNLPESGDMADFTDAHNEADAAELRRIVESLADAAEPLQSAAVPVDQPWPDIHSFDDLGLPGFPTHVLPRVLREWVEAESHATQTPADLAGLLALAVCSATIARRVEVEPRSGWREPVNLFVSVVLESGNRKSAVFADARRPLAELEAGLIEAERPAVARKQSERRQAQARLKKFEKQAGEQGDAEARHDAGNLAAELAEKAEPALPRLIVDDATSEKIGMMLAEQGGRIASMSPEGGVFDLMAGLYSKAGIPQFDVYLKAHAGDDLITDRVSRQSVRVERPALTCAYAVQSVVIGRLAENPAFRGRGLLARFLYAAPRSWIGQRAIAPAPVPDATHEAYRQTVRNLAGIEGEIVLRLAPEAAVELEQWEAEIETMLGDGGQLETMRDWGGKLAGATLRLAAVLHCVGHGATGCIAGPTLAAAIEIARYLMPHAEAVLNMMHVREQPGNDGARYVLRWIERRSLRQFTKSEAQHHGKRKFPKADDIDSALAELTRRGYIRQRPAEATGPGRPPSPTYDVNPALFADEKGQTRSHNSHNSAPTQANGNSGNIGSALERAQSEPRVRWTL
jgi:hypothetical protein